MKFLITFLVPLALIIILISCRQEKLLFYPEKLPISHIFAFNNDFDEYFINVDKKTKIHGLLFKAPLSKGLVFYLHGNAGSLNSWGNIADVYLGNNFDFFIPDYRGFGKSQGKISSEKQLYNDIQIVYDSITKNYRPDDVVIIGYSIGTGLAAKLASDNNPKLLVLKAPFYSMTDLANKYFKIIPGFLIRYKLRTYKSISNVKCPVIIFHGNCDEVVYYESSKKLEKHFKNGDRLITLPGQTHNGINHNHIYLGELKKILK